VLVILFKGDLYLQKFYQASFLNTSYMKTYIVDSFTGEYFRGNPAGVCFPEHDISKEKMLLVAKELGLSETAFLIQIAKTDTYTIRYFSPKMEIPLCGHATLASAKVLFKDTTADKIHFITIENLDLTVTKLGEEITMEFPVYDTVAASASPAMLAALGLKSVNNAVFSPRNKIIMLEISSHQVLADLNPDFNALIPSQDGIHGVLVTAPGADNVYDYHYRYFWPWAGTNEDPVTGSVQTFLAKYWSAKLNKTRMKAFQSSSRTGYMNIALENGNVLLTSKAVIMLEGNFMAFDERNPTVNN
jgi:PhzF family phenazine biosynthesis protein